MAMKVFVSLPVKNHDRQWIETEREEILKGAPGYFRVPEDEIEPVPFVGPWQLTGNHPVYCLGFNLQLMSQADVVVFHPDWWESKACVLQHDICEQYGIKHIDLSWRPSWDKDDGAMENERKQGMTKKLFISQPMNGLTNDEILKERSDIQDKVEQALGEKVELIDSFFDEETQSQIDDKNKPLRCLARGLELMADADIVAFAPKWEDARGCRIEHQVAFYYNLEKMEID